MIYRYTFAWLALMVIAIVNGTLREFSYGKFISELAAHQLSTLTGIAFTGLFVWFLNRVWALESSAQAWTIGSIWLAITILFEFGFGHFVAGHPWSRLLADYNLFAGRVWILFLLWILVLPYAIYRVSSN